jgi:hypothetical protein
MKTGIARPGLALWSLVALVFISLLARLATARMEKLQRG